MMMQILPAVLLLSLMSAEIVVGSDVITMCKHFEGSLVEFHVKEFSSVPESWKGLPHVFCETNMGVTTNDMNTTVFLDAGYGQGLSTSTIASTFLKNLPVINVQKMMRGKGAASPAAVLCEKLGGSAVGNYNLDYYFISDTTNEAYGFCVFGDGSFAQSWALFYTSVAPILESYQNSVYTNLREQITDAMTLPQISVDSELFLQQVDVLQCKLDSDCANYVDPCDTNQKAMRCDIDQRICVPKELTPMKCKINEDCLLLTPYIVKSYAQNGVGYCFPAECDNGFCRQGV